MLGWFGVYVMILLFFKKNNIYFFNICYLQKNIVAMVFGIVVVWGSSARALSPESTKITQSKN
jgi:hypothetical protein